MTEIPQKTDFNFSVTATGDIGLAACCLADDDTPRLTAKQINVYQDGPRERYRFMFHPTAKIKKLFAAWVRFEKNSDYSKGPDVAAAIHRAFRYCDRFVEAMKTGSCPAKPAVIPNGMRWTINTKIVASALALATDHVLSVEQLCVMTYQNGTGYGFLLREPQASELISAFDDPTAYVATNPDEPLSYLVAAFHHRDWLRDIVKQAPKRHVFREGTDLYIVRDPNKPKEIPHAV